MFLNIDKYEYPRTNKILKHLHKQQWLDYYECLKELYADMKHDRITYPSALISLEGTSITCDHQKIVIKICHAYNYDKKT